MKVINVDKGLVLDIDKFDYVRIGSLSITGGYPVEACKAQGDRFGGLNNPIVAVELFEFIHKENALKFINDFTKAWIEEKKFFDVTGCVYELSKSQESGKR